MKNLEVGPQCDHDMDADMAFVYCITLSHKGHKDWRMPTYTERITLAEEDTVPAYGTWDSNDLCLHTFQNDYFTTVYPVRDI